MTQREILIEDMQDIESMLCRIENAYRHDPTTHTGAILWAAYKDIRALARAIWHILTWIIKRIDEERRNK
jgi:hypothetical protein